MPHHKISLTGATLICLNTIVGASLFINPKELTRLSGALGCFGYLIAAIIIFPYILSLAELAKLQPVSGGLYVYSKTYIHSTVGFITGWSYFLSKSVAVGFLVHTFVSYFQSKIVFLAPFSTYLLDATTILLLAIINMLGVKTGGKIQYFFTTLKALPILFVFFAGFKLFNASLFDFTQTTPRNVIGILPISLFALAGFEMICSVGGQVENPTKNIKRAILTAFSSVIVLYTLFSVLLYGALGNSLLITNAPILSLGIKALSGNPTIGRIVNGIVFSSIIGGAYCVLTSNCWNLYTLANNNHLPGKTFLAKVSKKHVPWVSLLIEGCIAMLIIMISSAQLPLQNMSVFALYFSFLLTSIAAYKAVQKDQNAIIPKWLPLLAILVCGGIVAICLRNIIKFGISFSFLSIFFTGCLLALGKRIYLYKVKNIKI